MFLTFLLTLAGCLLIGRVASSDHKSPLALLGAMGLLGVSAVLHAGSGVGVTLTVGQAALELGIGLMLASGLIARRRGPARPFFALGALALLTAVAVFAGLRFVSPDRAAVSLLVELGPDDSVSELEAVLDRHEARAERAFPAIALTDDEDLAQVFIVTVPARLEPSLVEALGMDPENVDHVERNRRMGIDPPAEGSAVEPRGGPVLENDPLVGQQWALDAIRAHEAHRLLVDVQPASRARVAIIDTGVDGSHEDLSAAVGRSPALTDGHGHGSHCAGIAGGVTNNGIGIASLNWEGRFVEVVSYAALDVNGFGTIEQIAQAILDAARDGADVVSLSLGDRAATAPKVLADAIGYARRRDVVVVAAAGNASGDAAEHTPSNVPGVISVSALDGTLHRARFSNRNTRLDRPLAAPGVDILSLRPGGGYVSMSGTSMATPMVAGLAGILRSLQPDLSEEELYRVLAETARDVPDARETGRLIDAGAALERVLHGD